MLRKLLPLLLLTAAVASAQSGPPPGIPFYVPNPNAQPPHETEVATEQSGGPVVGAPSDEPTSTAPQLVLTAEDQRRVIDNIVTRLKSSYILPEMAQQLIAALQAHQQQDDYNKVTDAALFATRLTYDLQSVSHDRHLRVEYSVDKLPPEQGGPSAEEEQQYHKELDRTNCGFERVEILPGNIGYVRFDYFGTPDQCADTAATAMKFIAHTDAVIFDLRQNHGGDPAMVALLASYLFDRPTHLDDLYNRRENQTTQYWATPDKVTGSLPTQPVYVLTSRMTFSGAEQFSYDLHNLHRATLIGERTGGASHPTRNHRLDDHFLMATPEYRYINAVTRTDWEGQGVEPDVPAAPWNALLTAEKAALVRLHRTNTRPLPASGSR